jgi:hypothetical protein
MPAPSHDLLSSRMPRSRHHPWRWISITMLVVALVSELLLRWPVGLGDPPLYQADGTIEYLLVPGQYRRFGHRVMINSAHMRSEEAVLLPHPEPAHRLLVLGDSVVNGGSHVDQANLATELLPALWRDSGHDVPMIVCNVSAGSWGPANMLAYVQRFGVFQCSEAVVVLNAADLYDRPTFAPLGPEQPTRRPFFALHDLTENYGLRLLPRDAPTTDLTEGRTSSAADLGALIDFLSAAGVRTSVLYYLTRTELVNGVQSDADVLRSVIESHGAVWCTAETQFRKVIDAGEDPFRDEIHPSVSGQVALARAILNCLEPTTSETNASPAAAD